MNQEVTWVPTRDIGPDEEVVPGAGTSFRRNLAVIVAVTEYSNGVPPLRTPVNDARRLAEILRAEHGYETRTLVEQVSKERLTKLLAALREEVGEDDRVLFYFAGHGVALESEDGPAGYLVLQDGRLDDRATFLTMRELHETLTALPCRHLLAILDCCFAGTFRWSAMRDLSPLPEVIHQERYDRFIRDRAWQVLTSAAYDQQALDVLSATYRGDEYGVHDHSPFALALFEALQGQGDVVPKGAGDGVITATELYLYLRDLVEVRAGAQHHPQTPGLWPLAKHDKGEYIFLVPGHALNLPPAPQLTTENNPYRGLKSYDERHADLFFGRTRVIAELAGHVRARPLTVVLGASGTGKSSLVKAGVLPKLRAEGGFHLLPPLRLTATPVHALAALLQVNVDASIEERTLREQATALARVVTNWREQHPGQTLLLVIDQWEELVTLCRAAAERDHACWLLAETLRAHPDGFRLVLTLRSDFEPQFFGTPLAPWWEGGRYVVGPLSQAELREAIEGPASVRVLYFEPPSLVDKLIDEVIQTPGALPLLSFTLAEMYLRYVRRRSDNRALTLEDYEALGGVVGSLRNRVNEVVTVRAIGGDAMPVAIQATESDAGYRLRALLEREPLVRLVEARDAALTAVLLPARDRVEADDLAPGLGELAEATWIVIGADRSPYGATPQPEREVATVADNIRAWASAWNVAHLGPPADSPLAGKAAIRVFAHSADGRHQLLPTDATSGLPVVEAGQPIVIELENKSGHPLWMTLVDVGVMGRVSIPLPSEQLGTTPFRLGEDGQVSLSFPDGFPAVLHAGRESFVLILTEQQQDFTILTQEGTRDIWMRTAGSAPPDNTWAAARTDMLVVRSTDQPAQAANTKTAVPATPAPFFVPFLRNPGFVGREEELARLHAALTGDREPVGIIGLTGMGGVGKTQLAVEYCYRHAVDYPGGVFWVNAAEPLAQGLAALGQRLVQRESEDGVEEHARMVALRRFIAASFSLAEIEILCTDIGIQPEEIPGETRSSKALEVVAYCNRHGKLSQLIEAVEIERPSQDWHSGGPVSQQRHIEALLAHLRAHASALLVLDNLEEAALLEQPLFANVTLAALPCRLLFTTRRREQRSYSSVSVTVLPEGAALQLLLRERTAVLDPAHPEHAEARRIAALVGYLPLALKVAGAHLGLRPDVPLARYRTEQLEARGLLPVLDSQRGRERRPELRHEAAVAATLRGQWEQLTDENARCLLRVAGLLPEAAQIPSARLGLLAGVSDQAEGSRESTPLINALAVLEQASLVEELRSDLVRMHPLVRDFAARQTPHAELQTFRAASAAHLLSSYKDIATLERHVAARGLPAVEGDLTAALELVPDSTSAEPLRKLLRLLQRESHRLHGWQPEQAPTFFAQQLYNRARLLGIEEWQEAAALRLESLNAPHLAIDWRAGGASSALERTFSGHSASVIAVAILPDGRHALTASSDKTLKLWNLQTGEAERTLSNHGDWVRAVTILPNGMYALSASDDRTLKLWNLQSGKDERTFSGHSAAVTAVAALPDGRFALSASYDRTLKLWDLQKGWEIRSFSGHSGGINAVAISPDGRYALSASDDRTLKLWNLQSGKDERTFSGHGDAIWAVAISPDGTQALSAARDNTLKLWHLQSRQEIRTFSGHRSWVNAVAILPDGISALSASDDRTLKLWNLHTGQEARTLVGHAGPVNAVAISHDGTRALSGSTDGTLKLWNLQISPEDQIFAGHGDVVYSVGITPNGTRALSAGRDHTLKVWDIESGRLLHTFVGHTDGINDVVLTPDGRNAVTASDDRTIKIWDLDRFEERASLLGHRGWVNALSLDRSGDRLASASTDRTVRLWDVRTHEAIQEFSGHTDQVSDVVFSPDGQHLLSSSLDGTVRVWSVIDGTGRTLITEPQPQGGLAVSSDGRFLVSLPVEGNPRLWSLTSNSPIAELSGHAARVTQVIFQETEGQLITASLDGTVRRWALPNAAPLDSVSIGDGIWDLDIQGDRMLSGHADGTVRFWHMGDFKPLDVSAPYQVHVFMDAKTIPLAGIATLSVELRPARDSRAANVIAIPVGVEEVHCRVLGSGLRVLPSDAMLRLSDGAPQRFTLEAHLSGERSYTIELAVPQPTKDVRTYSIDSSYFGQNIIVQEAVVGVERPPILPTIQLRSAPLPHLVLEISADPRSPSLKYIFRTTCTLPGHRHRSKVAGTVSLPTEELIRLRSIAYDAARRMGDLAGPDMQARLQAVGHYLWDRLFPLKEASQFREFFWSVADRIQHWLIVEDGMARERIPWLPWEMVAPYQSSSGAPPFFLGERYRLARWVEGIGAPAIYPEVPFRETSLLAYVPTEALARTRATWQPLLGGSSFEGFQPVREDRSPVYGLHLLERVDFQQRYEIVGRNESGAAETGERPKRADGQLSRAALDLRHRRPLVAFSRLSRYGYTPADGTDRWELAERAPLFLRVGASAVIGSWWPTHDDSDTLFWSVLYTLLAARISLGEAVWTARQAVRNRYPERADWLAYTLIGDPLARPYRPRESEGYAVLEVRDATTPLQSGRPYQIQIRLQSDPPLDYQERLFQTELIQGDLQAHLIIPGAEPDIIEGIKMEQVGRSIRQARTSVTFPQAGTYRVLADLMEGETLVKSLRLTLYVNGNS